MTGPERIPGAESVIRLLVSDVDGTLVPPDKALTARTIEAAARLAAAGIGFTLISSRPPRGMQYLIEPLAIDLPYAAFNGGAIAGPGGETLEAHPLSEPIARRAIALLEAGGVDAWVFAGDAWLLRDPAGHNVDRERRTVRFDPTPVADFDTLPGAIGKIVGVSSDPGRLDACEDRVRASLGDDASISRSQAYYLDISSPRATKGQGLTAICQRIGVPLSETAVIGDMFNDVSMFEVAGLAVCMGQSPDAVKAAAGFVTGPNTHDGFAEAVERIILPRASRAVG